MEINAYQYGNTIRLECLFKDFSGRLEDPDSVQLFIRDSEESENGELETGVEGIIHQSKGFYYYDLVTEEEEKEIIYEWKGVVGTYPRVVRRKIRLKYI